MMIEKEVLSFDLKPLFFCKQFKMRDIQNNDDLHLLVDEFYKKLLNDVSIAYIFTEVVKIKLEEHLPILVVFLVKIAF